MKPGDRVKIMKSDHPAFGRAGVLMGWGELYGDAIVYVAADTPHYDRAWPIFVLRPYHVELIAEGDIATSRRLVEEIIEICEARGCPLRGLYPWAGPYDPKKDPYRPDLITG